jgi:hypothetical protein
MLLTIHCVLQTTGCTFSQPMDQQTEPDVYNWQWNTAFLFVFHWRFSSISDRWRFIQDLLFQPPGGDEDRTWHPQPIGRHRFPISVPLMYTFHLSLIMSYSQFWHSKNRPDAISAARWRHKVNPRLPFDSPKLVSYKCSIDVSPVSLTIY